MVKLNLSFSVFLFVIFLIGCTQPNSENTGNLDQELMTEVMTKERQQSIIPAEALNDLMIGNERYTKNNLQPRGCLLQFAGRKSASD